MMPGDVVLVRHPEVARAWAGRCYGHSDMGWSREGARAAVALVEELVALRPTTIFHSGMIRTRRLADRLARRVGVAAVADPGWRERDFGRWEGRTWQAIWRETGDEMDRMTTDPEHYRPGGGETTRELADRARAAWARVPEGVRALVVTHGGPIGVVRASLGVADLSDSAHLVPACASYVMLDRYGLSG